MGKRKRLSLEEKVERRNKIVTAIDKNNMAENVFTKIDSTLFVD